MMVMLKTIPQKLPIISQPAVVQKYPPGKFLRLSPLISERMLLFCTVCGASRRGLDSTFFQTLQWCWSSLLGNEKCVLMLSLQEKSARTGRKLMTCWRKKYMSKQHIQEIITGWSIVVRANTWTQNGKRR